MSKVVKIKQKDIENIVQNLVLEFKEPGYDDLESDENLSEPYADADTSSEVVNPAAPEGFFLVKNPETNEIYAIDTRTGEILKKK